MSDIKKIKPSLPSGTRDFLPTEIAKRNFLFGVIKSVFEKYGFQPIETPVLENLSTLTGKYGDEGDQLLFKILNSGDFLKDATPSDIEQKDYKKLLPKIAERGLRYDLTVPLARYVVQHQNDLVFPFKRYHIAPVWRADRPQKGRYREFYQCDADIIGSASLINEIELTQIFQDVFDKLKLKVEIRINNRKILEAISIYAGCPTKLESMTVAIDKLDKIGLEGISNELTQRGFTDDEIEKIKLLLQLSTLSDLSSYFSAIPIGLEGIKELEEVFQKSNCTSLTFDITLARGLNYYTGTIWEIKSLDTAMGSIGSGGRYANLTELFGGRDMPGVGISFGVERIYDIMLELDLFPKNIQQSTQLLFVHFSETNRDFCLPYVQQLRSLGIASELYPDKAKLDKQMKYANAKGIPFVAVVGDDEMNAGFFMLKNMNSGEQKKMSFEELKLVLAHV
jgi:histidyl-tRNA synthetase